MKSFTRKEVIIGALVILALFILFFGINYLKGINIFKATNYYYASYDNVAGLSVSAPVTINGYKTGLVREIEYDYNRPGMVNVEFSVDKSLRLPVGTVATVTTDILGTSSIALHLGNAADGYYTVGDTIVSATDAGMLAGLSESLMPNVTSVLVKVDTLLSNLNTITSNPALHSSVTRLDEITLSLNASLTSLRGLLTSLQPVAGDLKSISANVDTLTGDLAQVSGRLRDVPVDSVMLSLQATIANLEQITGELRSSDSSLGKLINDPALYDNLNATVQSLDSIFVDVKRNPKRYINIKVF